jgi:hypothetical protein
MKRKLPMLLVLLVLQFALGLEWALCSGTKVS